MNHKITRKKIALAALLHDIGKFWQRGDVSSRKSDFVKSYESWGDTIVPRNKNNNLGYKHALWTHKFIESHKELFSRIFNDDPDYSNTEFALLAARHHRPEENNLPQAIISMADKWAAKNERVFIELAPEDDDDKEDKYWGNYAYKKVPLHNIFDLVNRHKDSLEEIHKHVFDFSPLHVIGENPTIFSRPLIGVDKTKSRENDYRALWEKFIIEFRKQDHCETFEQHFAYIQSLLQKYCWCIPSSTIDMPYSNLYEHQKVVSALAVALWDSYQEQKEKDHFFVTDNIPNYGWQIKLGAEAKDPLLMACLDLSGIQDYIYDIATKSAAKALKGRSYDLQLIMQSLINEILYHEQLSLFPSSIIYSSGGKAYIILPNTKGVSSGLKEIQKRLEEKFHKHFGFGLYPALGWVSFRYQTTYHTGDKVSYNMKLLSEHSRLKKIKAENLANQGRSELNLGDLWRAVSDEAAQAKTRKYKSLLSDQFFAPQKHEVNAIPCSVTGVMLKQGEQFEERGEEDSQVIAPEVKRQIDLGHALARVDFMTMGVFESNDDQNQIHRPANLDTSFKLYKENSRRSEKPELLTLQYNNTELIDAHGFLFYGGNIQPQSEDGNRLSFHEFCKDENGGETKLGVLKMDVDNLGQIFIHGFKNTDKSFSAYSTLSFYLEAFFSGHINKIRNSEKYRSHIQIIYSGGDDIFAVGRWDKIIEFSKDVNASFHDYTGRQDIATLSAGIAIVRAKFPISKAADLADEAENASKDFPYGKAKKEKNAITFFGETVSWDEEFPFVEEVKEQFLQYQKVISRGFLHKLQSYKVRKDQALSEKRKDFSYKWHAAYTVSRMVEPLKKNETQNKELINFLTKISTHMMHHEKFGSDRYLDLIALSARWAEYLLKMKKE